jgi:hypothetical protein
VRNWTTALNDPLQTMKMLEALERVYNGDEPVVCPFIY